MSVTHATLPAGKVRKAHVQDVVHEFSGGALGSLLFRDTGAVDGVSWLAAGVTAGHVLTSNGAGAAPSWQAPSGGGGTPGGLTTQIQFNDGGAFGGDADFVWDKTNNRLGIGLGTAPAATIDASLNINGNARWRFLNPNTSANANVGIAIGETASIQAIFGFFNSGGAGTVLSNFAKSLFIITTSTATGGIVINAQASGAPIIFGVGGATLASERGRVVAGAAGTGGWRFGNNSQGFFLDPLTAADTMIVRNFANSGYGTVDALGFKVSGVAGASFSGPITNLTVVNGIVTAAS